MAPLEPWEKVLVNFDEFSGTVHGQIPCADCHGGVRASDKETAHVGLIARPSEDPITSCGKCHPDTTAVYPDSLHATQQGYWTALETRSIPENHSKLEVMFDNHCARCHTTCGDCHVGQPAGVGGGLLNGHVFEETPPMTRTCTACHGSRVGNEYLGKNEEIPGDVHFREGRMNCADCHTSHELHGQPENCDACHKEPEVASPLPAADHRYAGVQFPRCETCHASATTGQDGIEQHQVHGAELSCQVCHAVTYTSCDGCHVAISETTGNPYFEAQATYSTFLIGRNPIKTYQRPYDFVPVRHIPISPTSYQYYGDDLLPNFAALPTWMYATPHNIQRNTPQTESCNACHGNPALFLTSDKIAPDELEANREVIVEEIPELIPEP